jgi:KipI family sensor histidine kinase inhibitor
MTNHAATQPHLWRFIRLGEAALLVESSLDDVAAANRHVLALTRCVDDAPITGVQSFVPAINSVLIRFDPLRLTSREIERMVNEYSTSAPLSALSASAPERIVTIPVRYGGEHGPDLDEAARTLGLSPDEVITEHTAQAYRVLMIGFAPGFPYIGFLPARLTLPRRATPRTAVAAGSVAIAAGMTGIYPARLPGGWRLIGRTDTVMFDFYRDPPSLLRAGDGVQFVAIS